MVDIPKDLEEITEIAFTHDLNDPDAPARALAEELEETPEFEYDEDALKTLFDPGKGRHGIKNRCAYNASITPELNAEWRNRFATQQGRGVGSIATELAMRLFLAVLYDFNTQECIENLVEFAGKEQAENLLIKFVDFVMEMEKTVSPE